MFCPCPFQLSRQLGDVLELNDYRLGSQQRLIDNMNASLRLAEERTAVRNEQIAILEGDVSLINHHSDLFYSSSLISAVPNERCAAKRLPQVPVR
jgi:hypothetical protein